MKKTKKTKDFYYFIIARIIGLLVKPVLLWCLLKINYNDLAEIVALYYLVLSSSMVIFNNEAHFDFYKVLYAPSKQEKTMQQYVFSKKKYIDRLFYHLILFTPLVFVVIFLITNDIWISIVFYLMILFDKFFDEIQRILQFDKEFRIWSFYFVIKSLTPIVGIIISYLLFKDEMITTIIFFLFSMIGVLVPILKSTKPKELLSYFKVFKNMNRTNVGSYVNVYRSKLILNQLQSISTRNVPLTDRLAVNFFIPSLLPQMSVIAQLGSVSILLIDYFLMAAKRSDYLVNKVRIFEIASKRKLICLFVLSLIMYTLAIYVLIKFEYLSEFNFSLSQYAIIGLYYSLYAIGQHFVQFNFWKIQRKITLFVDVVFYIGTALTFYILYDLMNNILQTIIVAVLINQMVRLCFSTYLSINYSVNE